MHCVTTWTRLDNEWEGVSTRTIMELAKPKPEATHVLAHCDGGYTTNIPMADFAAEDSLFATHHEGAPLEADHGYPMRLVIPHLYAWKSAKWCIGVEFLTEAFESLAGEVPDLHLLVVGDGPLGGHIAELQARLPDRVTWTGALPPDEIPAQLAKMQIAVAPYPDLDPAC